MYDDSLLWAEDYDLVLKLAAKYDFKYLAEALYGYRTHQQNARNLMSRKERLYFEGLVMERHFNSRGRILDRSTSARAITLMMRYFALTGQNSKMLRYGLSGFGPFKSMVSSIIKFKEVKPIPGG